MHLLIYLLKGVRFPLRHHVIKGSLLNFIRESFQTVYTQQRLSRIQIKLWRRFFVGEFDLPRIRAAEIGHAPCRKLCLVRYLNFFIRILFLVILSCLLLSIAKSQFHLELRILREQLIGTLLLLLLFLPMIIVKRGTCILIVVCETGISPGCQGGSGEWLSLVQIFIDV